MPAKQTEKSKTPAPQDKKKSVSRSEKAGVNFPVGRFATMLKKKGLQTPRISGGTPVFMAATIEYLCAEILELAGNNTLQKNRLRIKPRHIFLAVAEDAELGELFEDSVIKDGGVKETLPSKQRSKKDTKNAGPTMQA